MTTQIVTDEFVYLDGNDKIEQFDLTTPGENDGEPIPATGLTGLTVHYAATKGGGEIDSTLRKDLVERTEMPGRYYATMEGSDITDKLSGHANQRVFAVLKDSSGDVKKSFDRFVKSDRYNE